MRKWVSKPETFKKSKTVKELSHYVKEYELMTKISTAPTGLAFGQLLRGDAEDVLKDLLRLIKSTSEAKAKSGLVANTTRRLKLVPVPIYGFET